METNRVKDLLKKDSFLRFLSVIIAVILWAYVSFVLDPQTQKEITNIPVKFVNEQVLQDGGLTLVNNEYFVSCEVSGRRNVIASLNKERVWAEADLAGYNKIGRNKISLKIEGLPSSLEIIKEPDDIFVELDKLYSIQKKINVIVKGEPVAGFAVDTPLVEPKTVQIDGSQKLVNSISDVTAVIDVSNIDKSITSKEKISIIDNNGVEIKGLKSNISIVQVTVPLVKAKLVQLKANIQGEPGKNCEVGSLTILPDKVYITGKEEVYSKITQLETDAIDLNGATGNISKKVKILTPSDARVVNSDGFIKVDIEIKKQITKAISISSGNIQIHDKSAGFDYKISADRIEVLVVGNEDIVNNINGSLVTGSISVKGMADGNYSVPITVNLPQGVKLKDNSMVPIKITQ